MMHFKRFSLVALTAVAVAALSINIAYAGGSSGGGGKNSGGHSNSGHPSSGTVLGSNHNANHNFNQNANHNNNQNKNVNNNSNKNVNNNKNIANANAKAAADAKAAAIAKQQQQQQQQQQAKADATANPCANGCNGYGGIAQTGPQSTVVKTGNVTPVQIAMSGQQQANPEQGAPVQQKRECHWMLVDKTPKEICTTNERPQ